MNSGNQKEQDAFCFSLTMWTVQEIFISLNGYPLAADQKSLNDKNPVRVASVMYSEGGVLHSILHHFACCVRRKQQATTMRASNQQ